MASWGTGLLRRGAVLWGGAVVHFSALSVLPFGHLRCALPPCRASACRCPSGAVHSWAMQLAWRGQEARAAPVPARSDREASMGCLHICQRDDVSAHSLVACGSLPSQLPLQLRDSVLSPVTPTGGGVCRGDAHEVGTIYPLLCRVRELQPAVQRGHPTGQGTHLWKGKTQIAPRTGEISGGVVGW